MDYKRYVKGGIWWSKQSCIKSDKDSYLPMIIVSEATDPCGKCMITVAPIKQAKDINADEFESQYAVPIYLHEDGYIICNELKTISTERLDSYEGQCSDELINNINKMISMYLNLSILGTEPVTTSAVYVGNTNASTVENHVTDTAPVAQTEVVDEHESVPAKPNFKKEIPDELDLGNPTKTTTNVSTTVKKKENRNHGKGAGNGVPVYCATNHKWYVSMYEAMKDTHVNSKKIKRYLDNGANGEVDGYVFSYKKEHERI